MKNRFTSSLLGSILLIAAFLRLYRISDYMTFLGDEGRDVLVAKGILEGQFTLLGPRASAGDFFLGPIYYYMIAPFLWLFRYDPVGPAIMVALFGVATVFLTYYVGRKFFDEWTGIIAAALYAVSPLVVAYSHSSWNPNVLPFFSLLLMAVVYRAIEMGRAGGKYFLFAGFLLGISLQLHYLALFLGVIVFFYVLLGKWYLHKKLLIISTIKNYLQIFLGFLIGFSPFLAFEARHGFPNTKTIFGFITNDTLSKGYEANVSFFTIVGNVFFRIFGRTIFNFPTGQKFESFNETALLAWGIVIVIVACVAIVNLYFTKNKLAVMLLYLWLFFGVLLFGFYKKSIYDYYFAFAFPLPFLITGKLLANMFQWKKRLIGIPLGIALFLGTFGYNVYDNPFKYEPNKQKNQVKTIAEFVISKTDDKPYNFALITPGNSDHAYRYYLEFLGRSPVTMENTILDPERKTVTNQLMVICEQPDCKPLGHPLFEVAGFGQAKLAGEWSVPHVKVFKLVHDKE